MDFQQDESGVFRFRPWAERTGLVHGFTTRATGNFRHLRSLGFLASVLGLEGMRLSSLEQVHSNELVVERSDEMAERAAGDGLLSNVPGRLLSIRTADCFAILLADHGTGAVAAVHAGWRGTAGRIAFRAVGRMVDEYGCRPEGIEALIGPGIASCCFEVGPETASQFDGRFVRDGAKPHVDLAAANRAQLLDAGLATRNIFDIGQCSHCQSEPFFSHRREGKSAGRMLAFIGLRRG